MYIKIIITIIINIPYPCPFRGKRLQTQTLTRLRLSPLATDRIPHPPPREMAQRSQNGDECRLEAALLVKI